jgi:hypothetical protein
MADFPPIADGIINRRDRSLPITCLLLLLLWLTRVGAFV